MSKMSKKIILNFQISYNRASLESLRILLKIIIILLMWRWRGVIFRRVCTRVNQCNLEEWEATCGLWALCLRLGRNAHVVVLRELGAVQHGRPGEAVGAHPGLAAGPHLGAQRPAGVDRPAREKALMTNTNTTPHTSHLFFAIARIFKCLYWCM